VVLPFLFLLVNDRPKGLSINSWTALNAPWNKSGGTHRICGHPVLALPNELRIDVAVRANAEAQFNDRAINPS